VALFWRLDWDLGFGIIPYLLLFTHKFKNGSRMKRFSVFFFLSENLNSNLKLVLGPY